jgi:glutamate-5-semialdehyde dehydrogenase
MSEISVQIEALASRARKASPVLATVSTGRKNRALQEAARRIREGRRELQRENKKDLQAGREKGLSEAMLDRLALPDKTVDQICRSLEEVIALPDPVGEILRMWKRPNGLQIGKMRIPLGVVGIIYESRPNVTVEASALCLKSGNAVILRGGSEAIHSNRALAAILAEACAATGLPDGSVQLIPVTDRSAVLEMLKQEAYIDLIIPRGGEGLIRFVVENSRIPVIKHYKGVCHIYVDGGADLEMARRICVNAKTQRPGVCNAVETVLVHASETDRILPDLGAALMDAGVEIRGCPETVRKLPGAVPAEEEDWGREYLDRILSLRVVGSLEEAVDHIHQYGSLHTESIITENYGRAQRFLREVQSSTVMVNASTRFSDGFEFGFGAEIGISTTKLHAYGPMGLEDLTTTKYIVYGQGQIRE